MSVHGFSGDPPRSRSFDHATGAVGTRPVSRRRCRSTADLYDAHGRQAYRLALGLLADEVAAADAVAEAFASLRRRSRLRRDSRARQGTLLLRAVYRVAGTVLESRSQVVAGGRATLLSGLLPGQRETLLLCLHGVSCAELAATGRTSTTEVAGQLTRALRHVRRAGLAQAIVDADGRAVAHDRPARLRGPA